MPTYRPDSPVPGGMTIIWLEPATGVEAGNEHRARILLRGVWKDPQMKLSRLINPTRGEPAARLFEEV